MNKLDKVAKVFGHKAPLSNDKKRYVGIEMEFCSRLDRNAIAQLLSDADLEEYVHLVNDGSIRPRDGYYGHELRILAPLRKRKSIVTDISKILKPIGYVNKTCGLHIHLDARKNDPQKIFNNLVICQTILYKMVPKSRQCNYYCMRTTARDFNDYDSRYQAINGAAYHAHRTIEVRLHSGTLDATKINNWIDIVSAIAYAPKIKGQYLRSLKRLQKITNLNNKIMSYIQARFKQFATPTETNSIRRAA